MALLPKALPLFEDLVREVYEATATLRFNDKSRQHILAVSLHGSVVEIAFGVLTVLKGLNDVANGTAAWILLRSLVEAYIDLLNIVSDPGYDEFMHAAFLDQQRRRVGIAQTRGTTNPFLKSITGNPAVIQHGQWVESELQRLKQKGVAPLSVKERFDRAGQLNLYDGPYSSLSQQTHNNLGVLEARHMEPSPQGFAIHYFRDIPDEDVNMVLDTAAGVLANSLASLKSLLEGGTPTGLEGVTEKLTQLRSLW